MGNSNQSRELHVKAAYTINITNLAPVASIVDYKQLRTFTTSASLYPTERDLLRKVPPELDPKILLDTKALRAVVELLDSLVQFLC